MGFFSWLGSKLSGNRVTVQPLPKVNVPVVKPATPVPNSIAPQFLKGFDISHHNGVVDFQKFKDQGYVFCDIKASDGVKFADPMFKKNLEQAKKFGFLVSAYHFLRPNMDAAQQWQLFKSQVGDFSQLDFVPCVDWEVHEGCTPAQEFAALKLMLSLVQADINAYPTIYTGNWYLDEVRYFDENNPVKIPDWIATYPLWLSWYSTKPIPKIQPWGDYSILQWIGDKYIPELGGEYDLNKFYGNVEQLKALGKK